MFCVNCGAQLSDGAKFCSHCGVKQESSIVKTTTNESAKLVPAKCTSCGGQLTVNPSQQAAVCPFCNSAFIVEQAINNYNIQMNGTLSVGSATINVQGLNSDNLIARAKSFEEQDDFDNALIYFNRVLDMDINNDEAKQGVQRVEQKKMEYVFFKSQSNNLFSKPDIVEVKRNRITVTKANGKSEDFFFNKMKNLDFTLVSIQFDYPGKWTSVVLGFNSRSEAQDVVSFIENALLGIYPN